jgi:IS605 OrfB family transposase
MRYNSRVIRIYLDSGYATIATSDGRIKSTFSVPEYYRRYLTWKIKSSTLSLRKNDNTFYLHCHLETDTPNVVPDKSVLGIDRGIVNVAVCSDNTFFNSSAVKNVRSKYAHLRAELQSKGTRSAIRKLRKMSGRERRFVTDANHCISKHIVQLPYTVFALEDLTKIRVQKRRGADFNRKLNNWSFYELEQFIRYKAESLGKQVILVDARFTSQKCSACGHVYKGNRTGSDFRCRSCGFRLHADLNASRNIAQAGISGLGRLLVNQPNVACL